MRRGMQWFTCRYFVLVVAEDRFWFEPRRPSLVSSRSQSEKKKMTASCLAAQIKETHNIIIESNIANWRSRFSNLWTFCPDTLELHSNIVSVETHNMKQASQMCKKVGPMTSWKDQFIWRTANVFKLRHPINYKERAAFLRQTSSSGFLVLWVLLWTSYKFEQSLPK